MKYIFVAGAPGSKWSSVVKTFYNSPSIDRSDYRDEWTFYFTPPWGFGLTLIHVGAYFDPGMSANLPEDFYTQSRDQLEALFDSHFAPQGTGLKIIKSHIFSNHVDFLKQTWPDCAIVLVHRSDDDCLGGWVKTGGFDIGYPDYGPYYKNLKEMTRLIHQQNCGIVDAFNKYSGTWVHNHRELIQQLNIEPPAEDSGFEFSEYDMKVMII